jgi:nucleoside-diphosphate-sugar epimerase
VKRYEQVLATSRKPKEHLPDVLPTQRIRFDLAQLDTWSNVPPGSDLLWCFPAAPLDSVQQFAAQFKGSWKRLVVLGSTSAYDLTESHGYPPPWIDESAPIDLSKPRVQGEEFLRKECAAIVLRVAGIYGPARNPIDWFRTGRVGPSRKYVNLIHVEDLAAICLSALAKGNPGEVYNVSDGTPRRWDEIYTIARDRWRLPAIPEQSMHEAGKRIRTHKLRDRLGESLRHPDLLASLDVLERSSATNVKEP